MQNFDPLAGSSFAPPALWQMHQAIAIQGPRHVPRSRSQQATRLHERMVRKPNTGIQVTTAMWQRTPLQHQDAPPPTWYFDQEDIRWGELAGDGLLAIRALAQQCIVSKNRQIFFKQTAKGWELTKMGHELIQVMQPLATFAKSDRLDLIFEPRIEMMLDAFVLVGSPEPNFANLLVGPYLGGWQPAPIANAFNTMGEEVRSRGGSASAGRAMQRHADLHAAQWREANAYFAKLAKLHPAGDIKRVQLELPARNLYDKAGAFRHMRESSGIFLRSAKLMYGDAMVGDARLIDRGDGHGYQAQVLLAFDGPTAQELAQIDQTLADIWREQASEGSFVNMNARSMFQYRATGPQQYGYETLGDRLEKAAIYLARTSEILDVRIGDGPSGLILGETTDAAKTPRSRGRRAA